MSIYNCSFLISGSMNGHTAIFEKAGFGVVNQCRYWYAFSNIVSLLSYFIIIYSEHIHQNANYLFLTFLDKNRCIINSYRVNFLCDG